jgi:hypothetical protein
MPKCSMRSAPIIALELMFWTTMMSCFTVLPITVTSFHICLLHWVHPLKCLKFSLSLTFFGLFSIGIFLNSHCTMTDISAPVSYNQVVVAPGNVLTEMKGWQDFLLSLFSSDVFSAILHVHVLLIISMFNDPKGLFISWLIVQQFLGASEMLDPSFIELEMDVTVLALPSSSSSCTLIIGVSSRFLLWQSLWKWFFFLH